MVGRLYALAMDKGCRMRQQSACNLVNFSCMQDWEVALGALGALEGFGSCRAGGGPASKSTLSSVAYNIKRQRRMKEKVQREEEGLLEGGRHPQAPASLSSHRHGNGATPHREEGASAGTQRRGPGGWAERAAAVWAAARCCRPGTSCWRWEAAMARARPPTAAAMRAASAATAAPSDAPAQCPPPPAPARRRR
jgi:hypothetical protein